MKTTLLLPLGTLCTARLLFGIGGSSVPAATSALFISLSPAAERGSAMVALLCVRAAGMTVGAVLGLGLVRLNLDDYLVCWLALTCLGLVAVAPLLCAAAPFVLWLRLLRRAERLQSRRRRWPGSSDYRTLKSRLFPNRFSGFESYHSVFSGPFW